MKNFRKAMRFYIPAIIYTVIFTLLCPYSLLAQNPEYKVPERSMAYLAQAQVTTEPTYDAGKTVTTLSDADRLELEPDFAQQAPAAGSIQIASKPAPTQIQAKKTTKTATRPTTDKNRPAVRSAAKIENTMPTTTEAKQVVTASLATHYETPLFSEALSKMQQSHSQRQAEAARLGIVLPSQGGDMAAVSPSLSKIQQTLKSIMAR